MEEMSYGTWVMVMGDGAMGRRGSSGRQEGTAFENYKWLAWRREHGRTFSPSFILVAVVVELSW